MPSLRYPQIGYERKIITRMGRETHPSVYLTLTGAAATTDVCNRSGSSDVVREHYSGFLACIRVVPIPLAWLSRVVRAAAVGW